MVEEISIDAAKLAALKERQEGHFFDFKSKRISPSKLTRTISAFANADGGELFVGIEDLESGWVWDGFEKVEAANGLLQAVTGQFPLGDGVQFEFLTADSETGIALRIEVRKSTDIVETLDKKVFVRKGAQNLPVSSHNDLERLKLNKGLKSYEDRTTQAEISDVSQSVAIESFMKNIVPEALADAWVRKQRLVVDDKPTVAGLLLFSDEPQIDLPKASIKIYRYKTSEEEGTRATLEADPTTIEGNVYWQIYNAVAKVTEIAESIPIVGAAGLEKIEYPDVAIHEIVTNAVLHRDYSINDDVHIRIFDNRIEVESPGVLPAHVTERNILDERFARNPKIVRLINKHRDPPNKDVGEGLNTSFQAMRELKLREPQIQQRENSVRVVLKHEKLGSNEELIVNYLREHTEINNTIARGLCAVGDANKMKRIFQGMMKSKIIERIPGRAQSKAAYTKGSNFPN